MPGINHICLTDDCNNLGKKRGPKTRDWHCQSCSRGRTPKIRSGEVPSLTECMPSITGDIDPRTNDRTTGTFLFLFLPHNLSINKSYPLVVLGIEPVVIVLEELFAIHATPKF